MNAPPQLELLPKITERISYKQDVGGSSPSLPTNYPPALSFQPLALIEHPVDRAFCEIPLTRGFVALVSPEDYERVAKHKWTAMPTKRGKTVYARRSVWGADGKCRTVLLHREVLAVPTGVKVDHADRNGLDCRRHNLRSATNSQNGANKASRGQNATGFLGVARYGTGYRGRVKAEKRMAVTRVYPCPVIAAVARDLLASRLHGDYAVLNFQFIPIPGVQL